MAQPNKVYQPLPLRTESDVEQEVQQNILVTSVDQVLNWARRSSLWPAMPTSSTARRRIWTSMPKRPETAFT